MIEILGLTSLELLGWIGGFLFAICGVPQAWKNYKEGHADGLSWFFLILWVLGEIITLIYIVIGDYQTGNWHWPLIFNYIFNILLLVIILRFKIWPTTRRENENT